MSARRPIRWGCLLAMILALTSQPLFAQSTIDPVQDAERLAATSYDDAAHAMETASSPQPSMSEEEAKRYHEFRVQQQHDKVVFAILLAVTALVAHFVVLRYLPHNDHNSANIVSATGLIYIVFGTIILVVIASTEAQLTASMGILGAVAGYLFGKHRNNGDESLDAPAIASTGRRAPT